MDAHVSETGEQDKPGRARARLKPAVRRLLFLLVPVTIAIVAFERWRPRDFTGLLTQAEAALQRKDHESVTRFADAVLRYDPDHAAALLVKGRALAAREAWREAIRVFERVGDDDRSKAGTARFYEGICYLELSLARQAEERFLAALRLNPTLLATHEQLASLYASQLRTPEMRLALSAVLRSRVWTPTEFVWFVSAGWAWDIDSKRIVQLQSYWANDRQDIASAIALAKTLLKNGKSQEATGLLNEVSEAFPQDARAQALRAELRLLERNRIAAAAILSQKPRDANIPYELWAARGEFALRAEQWEDARFALERAARLAPDDATVNYRLAQVLRQTGSSEEAARHFDRVRRLDQLREVGFRILGIKPDQPDEMAAKFYEAGELLWAESRWTEAAIAFERILRHPQFGARATEYYTTARQRAASERAPIPLLSDADEYRPVQAPSEAESAVNAATAATVSFVDVQNGAGLDFWYFSGESGQRHLVEAMGGGVACFDMDLDGWPDLFFSQGCRLPLRPGDRSYVQQLYRNSAGKVFEDVSNRAGVDVQAYGLGTTACDFDNDGFCDLFVACHGPDIFFRGNGDGTFRDESTRCGFSAVDMSTSVAPADFDRDGDLDLFVVNYLNRNVVCFRDGRPTTCHPRVGEAADDRVYENSGDGTFRDISASAGILVPEGKGLGVVAADLDNDGWADVYVANDTTPNFLFRNRSKDNGGKIQFQEIGMSAGCAVNADGQAEAGMGIACADFDGNGCLDLYVTNYYEEQNTLYLNEGNMVFRDATAERSLAAPTRPFLGFGTSPIDANGDGWPDLFIANGHVDDVRRSGIPYRMRPQFFVNNTNARFTEMTADFGEYLEGEYLGRGVAQLDWNRDARPDLVVVHQDRPAALLENRSGAMLRRAVVLELIGVFCSRDAINARVRVTSGKKDDFGIESPARGVTLNEKDTRAYLSDQAVREAVSGGYLGSDERVFFVPAGTETQLEVHWPDGGVARPPPLRVTEGVLQIVQERR